MEVAMTTILLRLMQVEEATGLKKSTIYARIKEDSFPVPVRLGAKAVAWRSDEIQTWIDNRPRAMRNMRAKKMKECRLLVKDEGL